MSNFSLFFVRNDIFWRVLIRLSRELVYFCFINIYNVSKIFLCWLSCCFALITELFLQRSALEDDLDALESEDEEEEEEEEEKVWTLNIFTLKFTLIALKKNNYQCNFIQSTFKYEHLFSGSFSTPSQVTHSR